MGFFDSLFGSKKPLSPEQLRELLFDAVAAGDATSLAKECAAHEAMVLEHFPTWTTVPASFRSEPDALAWYGQGLIAVARHFAASRGNSELLASLLGAPEDNPLNRWESALEQAAKLMGECRYDEAAPRLRAALSSGERLQGPGVDSYLPVTLGRLGECLFHTGDAEGAVAPTERALALCVAQRDHDGVVAYLGNLAEIHRYRGDAGAAASCLDRLAGERERLGQSREAASHRRHAALIRAGEPRCRVMAQVDGEPVEVADLPRINGKIRFVFARDRIALGPSVLATKLGEEAAQSGDYERALELFRKAMAADRFDPWPRYHEGLTLLHLRRYEEAIASYRATEELAPGFYHCRADRWLAERLAAGTIDHAMFSRLRALLDGNLPAAQISLLGLEALKHQELGVLQLLLGGALVKLGRDEEAEAAYRRGLAIAEEPDVQTRLLVALAGRTGDSTEKVRLLHEAMDLGGNLVAAAMASVLLRASPDAN
ncbi:MAG: tetratricopeptide repeat protein [Byssovorax sp.]